MLLSNKEPDPTGADVRSSNHNEHFEELENLEPLTALETSKVQGGESSTKTAEKWLKALGPGTG